MRKLSLAIVATLATAAFAVGPSVSIKTGAPSHVKAGKTFTISVLISIPKGYHIYGPGKIKTGVPTTVSVEAPKGFKVAKVDYPPTKRYEALGETVQVFEGTAKVTVTVQAPKQATGGKNFTVKVTSQACNDRSCLMPSTLSSKVDVKFN